MFATLILAMVSWVYEVCSMLKASTHLNPTIHSGMLHRLTELIVSGRATTHVFELSSQASIP